jgi:hypothetical protein
MAVRMSRHESGAFEEAAWREGGRWTSWEEMVGGTHFWSDLALLIKYYGRAQQYLGTGAKVWTFAFIVDKENEQAQTQQTSQNHVAVSM